MDTARLNKILEELIEVGELIDECPTTDRKRLYNLCERKKTLLLERNDLLSNKK